MYESIIENQRKKFNEIIEYFNVEAGKIRTGRANASLIENVLVDYYGAKVPLKQIASINVPESRVLTVQPWDKESLINIESAIRDSNLGFNPINDGQFIRIIIPPLTEERRKELVKNLHKKAEEGRIAVRNVREEIWKKILFFTESGKLSEDEKFSGKKALQEIVSEYNEKIEEIKEKKEKEIMTI